MEITDKIFMAANIDRGFSANARIHHGQYRSRHICPRQTTHVDRRSKGHNVLNNTSTNCDDMRIARRVFLAKGSYELWNKFE